MVTYGFYNSVDHDRTYDATQVSELFDGLINPGVYEHIGQRFAVTKASGFQVFVGTGRAWFNHTWTKNDASLVLTLPAPPTIPNRYRSDAIVIDINANIRVRENKITYVVGDESADPNPPHPSLATGNTHCQMPIAFIRRTGREEEIDPEQINYVVGTNDGPPWVTGVLKAADISVYVTRWETAWNTWFSGKQQAITDDITDFHEVATNATSDVTRRKNTFLSFVNEQTAELSVWKNGKEEEFNEWFERIRNILDEAAASHLQNEIDTLSTRIVPTKYGGTGNDQGYIQTGCKEIDVTLGEFSTSEGMNTVASGKSSHAEGGGNYRYEHQNDHFDSDNLVQNMTDHTYDRPINLSVEDVSGGADSPSNYSYGIAHTISNPTSDTYITSAYMALILTNETTGEILKKSIGCIGPASRRKSNYIGSLREVPDIPYNGQSGSHYIIDGGVLDPDITGYISAFNNWYAGSYNLTERFNADIDFYINLPYTGGDTVTITGNPLSDYDTPFSPLSVAIIDAGSGKYKGCEDLDLPYKTYFSDVRADADYDQACFVNEIRFNSDYSYTVRYKNNNHKQRTYRLIFSTRKTIITDGEGSIWDEPVLVRDLPKVELYYGGNFMEIRCTSGRILTSGANPGTVYSLKAYASYTEGDLEDDVPLEWIPAGEYIHISGEGTKAEGDFSHAEGYRTKATGYGAHAEGQQTTANANGAHAEGTSTIAGNAFYNSYGDHAEGYQTEAISYANGTSAHAEGHKSKAYSGGAHAEGYETLADDVGAHAEGRMTQALGLGSHAEGHNTKAEGEYSHAAGDGTHAIGNRSYAGGLNAIAKLADQFVYGRFGFGGAPYSVGSDYTFAYDSGVINGCLIKIKAGVNLTIGTNKVIDNTDLERNKICLLVILTDGNYIDVTAITTTEHSNATPEKHVILRHGSTLSSNPEITTSNSGYGKFTIPASNNYDRTCQIIRVM